MKTTNWKKGKIAAMCGALILMAGCSSEAVPAVEGEKPIEEKVEYRIVEAGAAKRNEAHPAILFNQDGFLSVYEVKEKLAIEESVTELTGACLQGINTEEGFLADLIKPCETPKP